MHNLATRSRLRLTRHTKKIALNEFGILVKERYQNEDLTRIRSGRYRNSGHCQLGASQQRKVKPLRPCLFFCMQPLVTRSQIDHRKSDWRLTPHHEGNTFCAICMQKHLADHSSEWRLGPLIRGKNPMRTLSVALGLLVVLALS